MKNILLLLPIAWLFGCQSSQKAAAVYSPQALVPTEKSVVWKISGNGLKKVSFLYGTIHLIPKKDYEMPDAVREALDHSKCVTFEIDMKELTNMRTQMSLMTKAFMPAGKTIKDYLSPEDYQLVKEKMAEKGLSGGIMERMKPLFLSTLFSGDEGGSATDNGAMTSIEMELYRSARNRKLETAGLETTSYQMSIFDSIPYQVQAKMLVDGLRSSALDPASGGGQLEQLLQLYRDQDIAAMQSMIEEDGDGMAAYEEILLKNRNRNWIAPMGRMMREQPTVFAVGAGHLGGSGGVIALLRKAGYRVESAQ
jgi:uncharacterized protein YbaP (TraB family)